MSVWKSFCRQVESKPVRRHFGDLVPLINTCAIFEFSDEQIENALAYEPGELAIPPFPFPRLCLVGPAGVVVLRSPIMDDGVLTYQTIVAFGGVPGMAEGLLEVAECTVRPGATTPTATNVRGIVRGRYFDRGTPAEQATTSPRLDATVWESRVRDWESRLTSMSGDDQGRARRLITDAKDNIESMRELESTIATAEAESLRLGENLAEGLVDTVESQFHLGLQCVQWINKPDHYTVEVGPSAPPRKTRNRRRDRVTRLAERPRSIVLTKEEIADRWHRSHMANVRASPMPHLRRGHYRRLRDDGAGEKRRVWVRASHVGGKCVEWRDGDVTYKVV